MRKYCLVLSPAYGAKFVWVIGEWAVSFAVEQAAAFAVEWAGVHVALAGTAMPVAEMAAVTPAAGVALAIVKVVAV